MLNDIRDLLGRYATGSLTVEERKRLFDAALDDQELFEELAREDEMKELFAGPGVRDRLIRALEPPKRRLSWVWALAPVAVLGAVVMVVLMRPVPKPQPQPQQVAVATTPASPAAVAPPESTASEPQPAAAPARVEAKEVEQLRRGAKPVGVASTEDAKTAAAPPESAVKKDERKEAASKAMDQVAAAPPPATPPPAPRKAADSAVVEVQAQASQVQVQGVAQGGPKQNAVQSARAFAPAGRALGKVALSAEGFGVHYSLQTAGHLIVIPSADGYLAVKSGDGSTLFASQRIAAGVVIDVVLPGSVRSVSLVFSTAASPAPMTPAVRTATEGDVQAPAGGPQAVAIELRINP
jgi:hypothetical protein